MIVRWPCNITRRMFKNASYVMIFSRRNSQFIQFTEFFGNYTAKFKFLQFFLYNIFILFNFYLIFLFYNFYILFMFLQLCCTFFFFLTLSRDSQLLQVCNNLLLVSPQRNATVAFHRLEVGTTV